MKGLEIYEMANKNGIKTCLIDFVKSNCNAATPSDTCRPILDCVINTRSTTSIIFETLAKEVQENYMMPAIFIAIILMFRLNMHFDKK